MPLERDRAELLEGIITEGERRKRGRLLAGGGVATVVVVLLAGVALAWPGGGNREEVTVADDPTTTTEAPVDTTPTSSTSTTGAPIETTTTTAIAVEEQPPPTTEPPLVCRNSSDPRCGPFYWDPELINQAMVLTATLSSERVEVGDTVILSIVADDPDAEVLTPRSTSTWTSCGPHNGVAWEEIADPQPRRFRCSPPYPEAPQRFGAWDPPAPQPGRLELSLSWVYERPGTYTISVALASGDGSLFPRETDNPYGSRALEELRIEVIESADDLRPG